MVKVGGGIGQDPATEVTHLRLNQRPVFSSWSLVVLELSTSYRNEGCVTMWLLMNQYLYIPLANSVLTTVSPWQDGGIQGAILCASICMGLAAENSKPSTIFSTDLHHLSTSPGKSFGLLSTFFLTCYFLSGMQFLQFPSPLSKMGTMPQIPHMPAFQSLAVMASKAKYPSQSFCSRFLNFCMPSCTAPLPRQLVCSTECAVSWRLS